MTISKSPNGLPDGLRRRLALVGTLALLLAPSPMAHAERNVHVPGTACSPKKADVSKINYTNISAVNEANSSAQVVCPVHFRETSTNIPSNMFIRVIDRSTSANVSCTVYAIPDGSLPGVVYQKTSSSSGTSDPDTGLLLQDIDHEFDEGTVIRDAPGWVFTITCTLPAATSSSTRSEIVDYQLGQGT